MPRLIYLIAGQFMIWIIIAILVATPIAYYLMFRWLANFAYRTILTPWAFIASALLALSIALATIGIKIAQAARINPGESLRYE